MRREIRTCFLPTLFEPADLRGGTAVVIDVLRAATTVCHALAAGARSVVPVAEVEAARQLAAELQIENTVLGGEREGKQIDGFDLDNSPLQYTPERVGDRTVVFTTTNGTRALQRCVEADRVLLGTFNNLSAVVRAVRRSAGTVHLVCSGTRGQVTAEDVLFAGAVLDALGLEIERFRFAGDETGIALDYYLLNAQDALLQALQESLGGRNVIALGLNADVERAAEIDRFDFVPEYDPATGRITRSNERA